jgi:hypothetical protein
LVLPHPPGRRVALALCAGRLGLGVGALFFTGPTLKAMLFGETDAVGRSLAKLAGGRDLVLGLMTLAARDDAATPRRLTAVATGLDAADAVSLGLAARDRDKRTAKLAGAVSGGGAALAGAWAARRLNQWHPLPRRPAARRRFR